MNPTNDIFQGLSILLLSEDDARGKALSKALRDHRARVGDLGVSAREGARGVDLAVVDARAELASAGQLAALRADVRGRWASVVTVDFTELVKADGSVLLTNLAERVAPLVEADRALTARAKEETSFKTSLSPLGPPRTLRALSLSGHTLFVELRTKTLDALIEVSNELLVSASATRGEKRWEAWSALVRILGLSECEITVSRRSFTSFMNIMEPVDQAIEVAAQERHCSAQQIAAEEAEAEARITGTQKMPPKVDEATTTKPAPPANAGAFTPPRPAVPAPPARSAGTLGHQRTLMGVMPGLPAPGVAANDVRAVLPPQPPEAPRYAHRNSNARAPSMPAPAASAKAASMTLMGVAPSAIPGLAELRAQRAAAEKVAEPANDARAPQREALKNALREEPDFDPPTVRHNLASLPDLTDELPDLMEDLSVAKPLSSPLPTPMSERDDEREPHPGMAFDDDDSQEQTIVASSQLTQELLAQALEGAATERPPALETPVVPASDMLDTPAASLEFVAPAQPEPSEPFAATPAAQPSDTAPADLGSDFNAGEETLVVQRKPEPKRSRKGLIGAVAGLAALLALGIVATRSQAPEAAPAAKLVPAKPAPAKPEPAPVAASAAPATAAEPAAAPSEPAAIEQAPIEQAPIDKAPVAPRAAVEKAPIEKAPIEEAPIEEAVNKAAAPSAADAVEAAKPAEPEGSAAIDTSTADQVNELLKKGQRLLAQRDAAGARTALEQAVALQGDNPHVRASLAEALLKLNELPLALTQAQTAVKLRPKRGRYLVLQGDVLAALGKADEARAAFQRAFELDPNDVEAKRKAGF